MDSTVTLYNPSLCMVKKLTLGASSATSLVQVGRYVYVADAKQIFVFHSQSYELIATIDLPQLEQLKGGVNESDSCLDMEEEDGKPRAKISNVNAAHTLVARRTTTGVGGSDDSFSGYFVRCMAVVGKYVWVCTDGFVCFVNAATHSIVPSVYIPIAKVNSIAWVPSTQEVWGGCSDSKIYIWKDSVPEAFSGAATPLTVLDKFTSDRISKLTNLNDQYIFCGAWDKFLRIWDPKTRSLLWQSSKPHECPIMSIVPLEYRWLRVFPNPQESKDDTAPHSSHSTNPTSSSSVLPSQQPNSSAQTPTRVTLQRRDTQSLPVLPVSQVEPPPTQPAQIPANPLLQSRESSLNLMAQTPSFNSTSPAAATATIWTIFTADWSSVSIWV
jgi:hypothetical protein